MSQHKISVYTFGCPHTFDPISAKNFNNLQKKSKSSVYRIQNSCDIVPTFPMPISFTINIKILFFYEHVGKLLEFTDNRKSYDENHSILTYIDNLKKMSIL